MQGSCYSAFYAPHLMKVASTVSHQEVLVPWCSHAKSVHHLVTKPLRCTDNLLVPFSGPSLPCLKYTSLLDMTLSLHYQSLRPSQLKTPLATAKYLSITYDLQSNLRKRITHTCGQQATVLAISPLQLYLQPHVSGNLSYEKADTLKHNELKNLSLTDRPPESGTRIIHPLWLHLHYNCDELLLHFATTYSFSTY